MPRQPTTAQLRADIDRGRTGNKVNAIDPAAAPLGTDDEAAGTPPSPDAVRQALDYERRIGRQVHTSGDDTGSPWATIAIYVAIVLALVALLSAGLWLSFQPA